MLRLAWNVAKTLLSFHILQFCGASVAQACRIHADMEVEDIKQADIVFRGDLIKYELVSTGRPNSLDEYGLLTVRVTKVLKGKAAGDVQFY